MALTKNDHLGLTNSGKPESYSSGYAAVNYKGNWRWVYLGWCLILFLLNLGSFNYHVNQNVTNFDLPFSDGQAWKFKYPLPPCLKNQHKSHFKRKRQTCTHFQLPLTKRSRYPSSSCPRSCGMTSCSFFLRRWHVVKKSIIENLVKIFIQKNCK